MEQELAQKLVTSLRESGIDVITYLPETRLSQILPLIRSEDSFKLIPVSSEQDYIAGLLDRGLSLRLTFVRLGNMEKPSMPQGNCDAKPIVRSLNVRSHN